MAYCCSLVWEHRVVYARRVRRNTWIPLVLWAARTCPWCTGDGEIVAPGQVLLVDGKIAEVGRKVGHPGGAVVVRGKAAMPGMIDALGHLGLEGSTRVPATRFELKRIVEPGDRTDERVAKSGEQGDPV